MDNFRKFNSRPAPRGSAVDGFRHTPGRAARPATSSQARPSTAPTMQQPQKVMLDEFRRSDGFRPAAQPAIRNHTERPTNVSRMPRAPGGVNLNLPAPAVKGRRGKHKKKLTGWKAKLKRGSLVVGVMTLLIGGFLLGKSIIAARSIFKGGGGAAALEANVDPAKLNGEGDGRVNIMMLGKGGDGHEAPDLTDTVLIASIDPVQNEAAILSIPRDLWVRNSYGSSKINAVYANAKYSVMSSNGGKENAAAEKAGLEAIEKTLEDSMGIPIHYYALVDFKAFQQAIDAVGGVDVNVKTPVYDPMRINGRSYVLDVKTGPNHFDGFRGLAYARSRMTSVRGDFDRGQRQREILIALKEKVISAGTFSNPRRISSLVDSFGNNVQTNLSLSEMVRLVEIGKNIPNDKVASLSLVDPPNVLVQTDNIGGQSVVVPKAGVGNFGAIQSFIRNALKDAFLKKEDASIAVFNGTNTAGLAATKAEELRSFGYNITTVSNSGNRAYQQTVLVDLRSGQKKYTLNYLEKRLNVKAVQAMPEQGLSFGNADFVIILGADQAQ